MASSSATLPLSYSGDTCAGLLSVKGRALLPDERELLQRKLARLRFHVALALLLIPVSCAISLTLLVQASLLKSQATTQYSEIFASGVFMLGMAFLMLVPAGLFLVVNDDYKLRRRIRQDLDFGEVDVYRGYWSSLSKMESFLSNNAQSTLVRNGLIEPSRQGEVEMEVLPFSRLLWTLNDHHVTRKITLSRDSYEQMQEAERRAWPVASRLFTELEKQELEALVNQYMQWKQTIFPVVLMLTAGTLSYFHNEWLPQSPLPDWLTSILFIGIFYFCYGRAFMMLFDLYLSGNSILKLRRALKDGVINVISVSTSARTYLVVSKLKDINGGMPELALRLIEEVNDKSQHSNGTDSNYGGLVLDKENIIEFLPESGTLWAFNGQPAEWR